MSARLSPPLPDALGEPWVQRRIALRPSPDYDGQPEAVLVHRREPTSRQAVLYLHGFTDYFFQADHAERWVAAGLDFYALDLRMSGRALGEKARAGDVRDLHHHDEEIGVALDAIRADGHEQVVLLGHSTGGLIAVSWVDRHPGQVDAVVLNSPWLEHNGPWTERVILTRVIRLLARWLPSVVVSHLDEPYGRWLREQGWDYDLAWKPVEGFPMRAGMAASVRREHARVARGLAVDVPVLLCCSTRSGSPSSPTAEELRSADCVLDVRHMVDRAPRLGPDVSVVQVHGGVHDLALSPGPAREAYESTAIEWVTERLAASRDGSV
ncbi:alpha/beta hydrolase [Oceanitalea stevensii]|uniref:Alpha/beta hydrolase n=1 Tax=Oceanitalea stevensii TaxID=2763072 RepID=A0ABR8Z3A8_9MICO|nr:alpha/beta hydrolase [Oceanitalea stevensii]MBD8062809.1 alpha/beta hydrolase [Oceanitalea stevensii]